MLLRASAQARALLETSVGAASEREAAKLAGDSSASANTAKLVEVFKLYLADKRINRDYASVLVCALLWGTVMAFVLNFSLCGAGELTVA